MQLLAACQKAETFRKLVVQSSVSVYGASPRDPARFTEDLTPRVPPRTGFGKDSVEVESYVRGLARRRPTSRSPPSGWPT
jgi:UDP-glucose 4-epimerase